MNRKKNISIVRDGVLVDVGRFEKSHVDEMVSIYSRGGERIGSIWMGYVRFRVLHKTEGDDYTYIIYSIVNRKEVR